MGLSQGSMLSNTRILTKTHTQALKKTDAAGVYKEPFSENKANFRSDCDFT